MTMKASSMARMKNGGLVLFRTRIGKGWLPAFSLFLLATATIALAHSGQEGDFTYYESGTIRITVTPVLAARLSYHPL
jgi:hypothetical protein